VVFEAATRVLRLAFVSGDANAPDAAVDDQVDFVAYAADRVLAGRLRLHAARLTDLLNGCDEVDLVDIVSLGHDGQVGEAARTIMARGELLVVKAGSPRGDPTRRHRTRQTLVSLGVGPYVVYGYIHARPGADALIHFGRRATMVPITDASIGYEVDGVWRRDEASTLIVNCDQCEWIRAARETEWAAMRVNVRTVLADVSVSG
jgi:hypothetical protein